MSQENKTSIVLGADDVKRVLEALRTIKAVLKPQLVSHFRPEFRELPRMSDDTAPFVQKVLEYAQTNTGFMPAYLDVNQLKTDFEAATALAKVFKPIEQLYISLNDTMTLSGSGAFVASLAFYKCNAGGKIECARGKSYCQ